MLKHVRELQLKLEIDFLQYCAAPRKRLTPLADLGLGQFTMTATLEGSIFNSPPPTI